MICSLSRPAGLGARGAAAEAAFRRLSIEERDEVVAALVAEFKAGEREGLRCWHAGRLYKMNSGARWA